MADDVVPGGGRTPDIQEVNKTSRSDDAGQSVCSPGSMVRWSTLNRSDDATPNAAAPAMISIDRRVPHNMRLC